jgi:hypothetical protein
MLVINLDRVVKGYTLYAQELVEEQGALRPVAVHRITEEIYARHPLTGEVKPIRPFALTNGMISNRAEQLKAQMEQAHPTIEFQMLKKVNCHILAEGSTADLKKLPEQFRKGGTSKASMLGWMRRMAGLPFAILEHKGEPTPRYEITGRLPREQFNKLREVTIDSEWRFWEKRMDFSHLSESISTEQIATFLEQRGAGNFRGHSRKDLVKLTQDHYNVNLGKPGYTEQPMTWQICEKKNGVFHVQYFEYLRGKEGVCEFDLPAGHVVVHTHKARDTNHMQVLLQEFLDKEPITILQSQNGMSYDLLKTRQYTAAQEKIERKKARAGIISDTPIVKLNIAGVSPKISADLKFSKKVTIPTAYQEDVMHHSRNSWPFTKDNKFSTVASLVNSRKVSKREGYDDLTRLSVEMEIGSEEAADQLRLYAIEDVVELCAGKDHLNEVHYLKALLFRKNPEDVGVTSKKRLALDEYQYSQLEERLEPLSWKKQKMKRYNEITSAEAFANLLPESVLRAATPTVRPTFTQAALYYLTPFSYMLAPLYRDNDAIKAIFSYVKEKSIDPNDSSNSSTLARFDLMNTLEDGFLLPYILEQEEEGFKAHPRRVQKVVERFSNLVTNHRLLNRSDNFLVVPLEVAYDQRFQHDLRHLGFKVAEGNLMNVGKGSFMLHDGVTIYKRDIDAKGTLGFKSLYQIEIIGQLVERVFEQGPEEALTYTFNALQELADGRVEREKLIHFKASVARDYQDYSAPAQRQLRIKQYIADGLLKGDKFAKAILAHGSHPLKEFLAMPQEEVFSQDNILFFLDQYLGPQRKNGRDLSSGAVGRYLEPLIKSAGISSQELEDKIARIQGRLF